MSFAVGGENLARRRFPRGRLLKEVCDKRFKGARCKYAGSAATCSHTLTRCRELGNSANFGGFPGVGGGGVRIAD
ncbi:MAG: hypothetical protein AB1896_22335 [Thermodesulfobacteriota bacterium]